MRSRWLFSMVVICLTGTMDAQTFDALHGLSAGNTVTFFYERTGIPTSFMPDTLSTFDAFSGTIEVRVDSVVTTPGDPVSNHHLTVRRLGVRTIRKRHRVVSSSSVEETYASILREDASQHLGAGNTSLQGWFFADTVRFSPRCPNEEWGLWYSYPRYYRFYDAALDDSLQVRGDSLLLRTRYTDCLDYGIQQTLTLSRTEGLVAYLSEEMNFFDWSATDSYRRSTTDAVGPADAVVPSVLLLPNYPNPVRTHTTIPFVLSKQARVVIDILDLHGAIVTNAYDVTCAPGMHWTHLSMGSMPPGMYLCRLRTPESSAYRPILVLE